VAHAGAGFILVGDDYGWTVGEARRGADLLDGLAQCGLDLLEQGLEFLRFFGGGVVLEIVAGGRLVDGLEIDVAVLGY
jgi:hypothetical protein